MNYRWLGLALSVLLVLCGCAGPISNCDADRNSESTWEIKKKGLSGPVVNYKVKLVTKGKKFKAEMYSRTRDVGIGQRVESKWTVRCDGSTVWVTDRASSYDGGPYQEFGGATQWTVDDEFLRPQLFWKSNFLAAAPNEIGTEEIDGKTYKQFQSVVGNAMGGTTKYTYAVDTDKHYYRRWTREFVGDSHIDSYDCTSFENSTSVSDSEFSYSGEAEKMKKFDIFNESL